LLEKGLGFFLFFLRPIVEFTIAILSSLESFFFFKRKEQFSNPFICPYSSNPEIYQMNLIRKNSFDGVVMRRSSLNFLSKDRHKFNKNFITPNNRIGFIELIQIWYLLLTEIPKIFKIEYLKFHVKAYLVLSNIFLRPMSSIRVTLSIFHHISSDARLIFSTYEGITSDRVLLYFFQLRVCRLK